jgi:hypothetical protein
MSRHSTPFEGGIYRTCDNWFGIIPIRETPIKYLEIGVFYGANVVSCNETYAKHPLSELYCIDPWEDYNDYSEYKNEQNNIYELFKKNIKSTNNEDKFKIHKGFSHDIVPNLPNDYFDIIYIDGNHNLEYVLEDAVLCFRKLKSEGYMIFDDFGWGGPDLTQRGIEAFIKGYRDKLDSKNIVLHNTQIFVKKL